MGLLPVCPTIQPELKRCTSSRLNCQRGLESSMDGFRADGPKRYSLSMRIEYRLRAPHACLPVLLVLLCSCAAFAQNVKREHARKRSDVYLSNLTAKNLFRGSVLVGVDGKIIFEKGYGLADEEGN